MRPVLTILLFAGALWQLGATVAWAARPLTVERGHFVHPLPFTWSSVDFFPDPGAIDRELVWLDRLRNDVEVVVPTKPDDPSENCTDPQALLERLYLSVGHARFVARLRVTPGLIRCSWASLPLVEAPQPLVPDADGH
jgi:hypothetical protein